MISIPFEFHRAVMRVIRRLPRGRGHIALAYMNLMKGTGPITAPTYFGANFICDPRDLIQARILFFGKWEPEVTAVIEHFVRPGDVFVDVGANIGYDTLLASRLVGKAGSVVSIEASPNTFKKLEANIKSNGAGNVRTVQMAASDRRETLELYFGEPDNLGGATTIRSLQYRGRGLESKVDAAALDEILTLQERQRVTMIKMDIEGAEGKVLERLMQTLELYPSLACVLAEITPEADVDGQQAGILDDMRTVGFRTFEVKNDYNVIGYMDGNPKMELKPLTRTPTRMTDVLFLRGSTKLELVN